MGLFKNEHEIENALKEMAQYQMPKEFRTAFISLIYFSESVKMDQLWNVFKKDLMEDFIRSDIPEYEAEKRTLEILKKKWENYSMKWKETGMPDPKHYRKKNDDEEFEKKLIQKKEKSIK